MPLPRFTRVCHNWRTLVYFRRAVISARPKPVNRTYNKALPVYYPAFIFTKIFFISSEAFFPISLMFFTICTEKVCYKVGNMYYKVSNMCYKVCNKRYKPCNKKFLIG